MVTNSHTIPVQNKIRLLGKQNGIDFDWLVQRVVGSARKYVIDDSVTTLPESITHTTLGKTDICATFPVPHHIE